ncbi:elongation factor-1 alpha [Pseudomonadota bacterium]
MRTRFARHFSHLPIVQKALYTGVLCVLGCGYLFAMIYIFASHHGRDGNQMLTIQDIVIAYSGSKTGTKLESALQGPMSGMLPADENLKVVEWVQSGASQKEYEATTKAIFDNRCITCHNDRNPHLPSLETYDKVKHTAEEDTGMDLFTLVRVSHIHLFGLTFIFYLVGSIFIHAYVRHEWLKIAIIIVPFVSITLDISSWYLTKFYPPFAWLVVGSGALMGISFALQFFISIYQMWFYKLPEKTKERFYRATVSK